jgi:SAM-dependent methyltransferase
MTRSGSTEDGAQRFFDAIARRYDRTYAPPRDVSREKIAGMLRELPAHARVLDLGVGTGRELSALQDAGHEPTGLDLSPEMLAICARRSRPVPLVQADFWKALPFADGSFDAVIALHGTLAHPPEDGSYAELTSELARVLGPDGVLVAEVPSPAWIEGLERAAAQGDGFRARRTGPNRCVHEDLVTGVAIEARVLSVDEWRATFAGWSAVRVEAPFDPSELVIIARR